MLWTKVSLHVIFAVFLKMHQLHTLNTAWRQSLAVQNSGNPLARVKDMIWVICPQGIGIKTVIQYMQTIEHLN